MQGELTQVFSAIDGDGIVTPSVRYRTHRAVGPLLEALAMPKPLVLLFDYLHWADAGLVRAAAAPVGRAV